MIGSTAVVPRLAATDHRAPTIPMLDRVLEPEYMDTPEEARDYDSMDHAEVNRRFVDNLLAALSAYRLHPTADNPRFRLLDVGTGTAQITIELCRRADSINVVAVDAAV